MKFDHDDQEVYVGIRPEGFIVNDKGVLSTKFVSREVMGRDSSVVSKSDASETPIIRSIIDSDKVINPDENGMVHFDIKPNKIFVFNRETEERLLSGNVSTKNAEEAPVAETPVEETVTTEEAPAPEVVDALKAPVEAPKKTTTKKTTTKKTVAKKTTKKSDEEK